MGSTVKVKNIKGQHNMCSYLYHINFIKLTIEIWNMSKGQHPTKEQSSSEYVCSICSLTYEAFVISLYTFIIASAFVLVVWYVYLTYILPANLHLFLKGNLSYHIYMYCPRCHHWNQELCLRFYNNCHNIEHTSMV